MQKCINAPWSTAGTSWQGDHLAHYLAGREWRTRVFASRVALLSLLAPRGGALADVGGAAGLFAHEAASHFSQVDVVEPDEQFRNYSERENPSVRHFAEASALAGSYDVVTCFDTIGYATDLREFLDALMQHLKPGGYLFISSVCADEGVALLTDKSFNFYLETSFFARTLPARYPVQLYRLWTEHKTFNTRPQGSPDWWRDYLKLDPSTQMTYAIMQRERESPRRHLRAE